MVLGDVVDVDLSCKVDYQVQGHVKGVVDSPPISHPLLVGSVQDDVLNHHSFLVVDKTQIKGILSSMLQYPHGMSEAITNRHSFQPCDLFITTELFQLYFGSNCWSVLSCVALPKNEERFISCDAQLVETAI